MRKVVFGALIMAVSVFAGGRGYGGFVLSYMTPDLSKLSDELKAHGLPALDNQIIGYGASGWGGGNLTVGGWGFKSGGYRSENDSISAELVYSGGFFEAGYFINIFKGIGIKPAVGIGGTTLKLKLRPVLGDVNFGDLLDKPARTSEVKYATFSVAPSVSILIPIEFVALEIKGGYMYSPFAGEWKLEDGANLRNAPSINPSGVFASAGLLFGGGSYGDDD